MAGNDHVAGAISDAGVGVGGNVVKKLVDFRGIVFGGRLLLCANGTECKEKSVVDGTAIREHTADNALDPFDSGFVEGRAIVWGNGILDFVEVCDGRAFMQRDLRFGGGAMDVLGKDIFDVAFHGEPEGAVVVVPGKVDASILGSLPVLGDGVVLF